MLIWICLIINSGKNTKKSMKKDFSSNSSSAFVQVRRKAKQLKKKNPERTIFRNFISLYAPIFCLSSNVFCTGLFFFFFFFFFKFVCRAGGGLGGVGGVRGGGVEGRCYFTISRVRFFGKHLWKVS